MDENENHCLNKNNKSQNSSAEEKEDTQIRMRQKSDELRNLWKRKEAQYEQKLWKKFKTN